MNHATIAAPGNSNNNHHMTVPSVRLGAYRSACAPHCHPEKQRAGGGGQGASGDMPQDPPKRGAARKPVVPVRLSRLESRGQPRPIALE